MLEVKSISASYGTVPVLRDISLSASAGEILLIVGENGAGKTTLLRTIGGLIKPTAGTIEVDGEDLTAVPAEQMPHRGLRLVLDGHRIFPELGVMDNFRICNTAGMSRSEFRRAVDNIFEVFPILAEKRLHRARDLSGGQQQMLALAQAFLAKPKVLLCDEPSTGLAQSLLPLILKFLRNWAEEGTAVVIVEQHLRIALPVADRAILMERGEITLSAAAAEFGREMERAEAAASEAGASPS